MICSACPGLQAVINHHAGQVYIGRHDAQDALVRPHTHANLTCLVGERNAPRFLGRLAVAIPSRSADADGFPGPWSFLSHPCATWRQRETNVNRLGLPKRIAGWRRRECRSRRHPARSSKSRLMVRRARIATARRSPSRPPHVSNASTRRRGGSVTAWHTGAAASSDASLMQDQAPPLAMMWNTNPSTVIPTATAAIGSRTSAVAFAPLTGPVEVSNSPTAQSRKLR